jgi:hypothetical protein
VTYGVGVFVEGPCMSKASEVEQQFARQFVATDWTLFKRMADANLSEAAHLRIRDMRPSSVTLCWLATYERGCSLVSEQNCC